MGKVIIIASLILLIVGNSCKRKESKIWETDNLTPLRSAYGIVGYREILTKDNVTTFKIVAVPTTINYSDLNLNNAIVEIVKKTDNVEINIHFADGSSHKADISKTVIFLVSMHRRPKTAVRG